jgi:hypothetical protein
MVKKILRIFKHILKGYAKWAWYYISKSYREKIKAEAKRRIEICEKCPYFESTMRICSLCGCFMDIKTKSIDEICYDNRW